MFKKGIIISIHALREESDTFAKKPLYEIWGFQSTLSVRRATWNFFTNIKVFKFQSTLSVRRATKKIVKVLRYTKWFQSTLSVRRATFGRLTPLEQRKMHFNPRSPWGERHPDLLHYNNQTLFQSTLSVRRATLLTSSVINFHSSISIHALREESDKFSSVAKDTAQISIHALREESDGLFINNAIVS